jgi:hypothetical protein
MRVKHAHACHRAHDFSPQIQPMIPVPLHASLPSGHATEGFIFAYVLWRLLNESGNAVYSKTIWVEELMRQASRIAVNRTIAGVHFPVDSAAGSMLGLTLGRYLVARCKGDETYDAWQFDGTKFAGDFNWSALFDVSTGKQREAVAETDAGQKYVTHIKEHRTQPNSSRLLGWLWNAARGEWPLPRQ